MAAALTQYFNFTPSDTVNFALWETERRMTDAIYVGGAGSVAAVMMDGTVGTFSGVVAGTALQIAAKRVNAAGTTATGLMCCYET